MLKRFGQTLLLTVLGGILGFSLALAFVWGWSTSDWVRIEASPEPIVKLLNIERDQIWVESESGVLYEYLGADCESECWQAVKEIPEVITSENFNHFDVKDELCSPAPPFFGAAERIEECHVEMWANRNYAFALRKNSSIHFWQSDVYGEWLVVELFFGLCGGAIIFLIPASLFILLPGIVKQFSKRSKK